MRPLYTLFFVPAVGLASALAACGGDTRSGGSSDVVVSIEQPATTCPTTLDEANAHACATEGMLCDVPLMCSTAYQVVKCTCQKGVFSCSDAVGVLAAGQAARCVGGPAADTKSCPPSFAMAEGARCTAVGRTCAYPGDLCPGRPVQLTDYCQCKRDPSDGTMTLDCTKSVCPPE